jgi:hypothetical protein
VEDLTAAPAPNGALALFEFTGALPRASVYTHWESFTNSEALLARLGDAAFNPAATVLVSDEVPPAPAPATNGTAGTVEFASYSPKKIVLNAQTEAAAILLLNDRYDAAWQVTVNDQPQKLLRCNFIMRGVRLPPGKSTIEFSFHPSLTGMKISGAAMALGLLMCVVLPLLPRRQDSSAAPANPTPATSGGKTKA